MNTTRIIIQLLTLMQDYKSSKMETGSDKAAIALLCRAVELDGQKRKTEAVVCYLEGIQLLINHRKELKEVGGGSGTKISAYDAKAREYMKRVEQLKSEVEDEKRAGQFHEQIKLDAGSTGNSYRSLFGRLLDEDVTRVCYITLYEPPQYWNVIFFTAP